MLNSLSSLQRWPEQTRDLLTQLGVVTGVIGLIFALIQALPPSSSPGTDPDLPSETCQGAPDYTVPGLETQEKLETIRMEINLAIKELRMNEGVDPVVMDPVGLQIPAQNVAECSAVKGSHQGSDADAIMIQHALPVAQANGHNFLQAWLSSDPHTQVMIDSRYVFYGIGVAIADDQVWVAVQFTP